MALSRDERAERRRLNAILSDVEYGPALVRLPKSEQRVILDLISENKGKEARSKIIGFTEERSVARRAKAAAKRASTVRDNVPAAARNMEARIGAEYTGYVRAARGALQASLSTQSEYVPVIGADHDTIARNASAANKAREAYSVYYYHY